MAQRHGLDQRIGSIDRGRKSMHGSDGSDPCIVLIDRLLERADHKVAQGLTRSHKVSQGLTRPHKALQGLTRSHKVSQGLTRPHKVSKGSTRSHKVSQGLTRSHKVSQGLKQRKGYQRKGTNQYAKTWWNIFFRSRLLGITLS